MTSEIEKKARRSGLRPALRICSAALLIALSACGGGGGNNAGAVAFTPDSGGTTPPPASGGNVPQPGEIACKDFSGNDVMFKPKTITIQNNSDDTIYPVLATSKNAVNEWVQGCFRVSDKLYPTDRVYKLYVNEGKGIPKNSSVEITLPLYSELAKERYITWWNGGRVVLANNNIRLRDEPDEKIAAPAGVVCKGENTACELSTYASDVQFPENIHAQLSEYTFGDSIIPTGQQTRLLKPDNVGYNISYVDHVFMPVAIGVKSNPYIGYSGSAQTQASFTSALSAFLAAEGEGWPVYNLAALKLPGGYNIFAQRSGTLPPTDDVPVKPAGGFPPVLTVLPCIEGQCDDNQKKTLRFGTAVQRMQNLWGSCVAWGGEDISSYVTESIACPQDLKDNMAVVKQFFEKNHQDYLALVSGKKCESEVPQKPAFNYWEAMMHIYGWVPFNEGCGAGANPLDKTEIPGWTHAKIQPMYIHDLQYNHQNASVIANPKLTFNPYVKLIHDDLKMNAYAFSVDDAVGFMSELGSGLVFTVGGTKGLPNERQFNYANGFSMAMGVPKSLEEQQDVQLIKKYGACELNKDAGDLNCEKNKQDVTMPEKSQISGFRIGTVASYPLRVRFTDANDNLYSFVVNEPFASCAAGAPAPCPTNWDAIKKNLACTVTNKAGEIHAKSTEWCAGANPNEVKEKQLTKNFMSFPKPVDFL